tara:strand:- start:36 stop:254 length:219 start_codon:yes stop_codon:yes gene_type:complete
MPVEIHTLGILMVVTIITIGVKSYRAVVLLVKVEVKVAVEAMAMAIQEVEVPTLTRQRILGGMIVVQVRWTI